MIWIDLTTLTWLFFHSPSRERWWKTPPITFRRISLVSPRHNVKCMRVVYPYIPGNFNYSKPGLPCKDVYTKLELVSQDLPYAQMLLEYVYVPSFDVRHVHWPSWRGIRLRGLFYMGTSKKKPLTRLWTLFYYLRKYVTMIALFYVMFPWKFAKELIAMRIVKYTSCSYYRKYSISFLWVSFLLGGMNKNP